VAETCLNLIIEKQFSFEAKRGSFEGPEGWSGLEQLGPVTHGHGQVQRAGIEDVGHAAPEGFLLVLFCQDLLPFIRIISFK